MYIQLIRLQDNGNSTIGVMNVNGQFECFTLEDTYNEPKIYGKTCIPSGKYDIQLRTAGSMHSVYSQRYGNNHKGMLWLQDVPDFTHVYIHVGNSDVDTDGCILIGQTCNSTNGTIGSSRLAYEELNIKMVEAFNRGEEVTIEVI